MSTMSKLVEKKGSCHCGRVRFTVDLPTEVTVVDCNCSICQRKGGPHLIVSQSRFRLDPESDQFLTKYQFGTKTAQHFFCNVCGVHPFSIPRSNPDGWDLHVGCLEDVGDIQITVEPFDGQNWEQQRSLAHLSSES
ncbi:proline-rich protein 6 [Basidiobolus meristosporus CBS 931.73]|uniref:Proline-rich protein 6 n=1 Tax=Basidiobolus meristosporus CBS 931.73 TaxID=1314790 RepID=A0A1Y1XDR6_9FUNG|nr:proline-rich protein 6 [Basidiobolus meristosporus CBS 931.73]|eukprot:ORX83514.1 proline-rich protein 6 [Basidiobolus meristosporus CBS 931.73]